jgi:hypothetical protein
MEVTMGWILEDVPADAGVWELKDSSDNELGIVAIWWGSSSGDPWSRPINEFRCFAVPLPTDTKIAATTAYGTLSGATVAARRSSFQDLWDEFKSETGFSPGEDVVAEEWIGIQKDAPDFDV